MNDVTYMREAINQAQLARAADEVPVGAVVVLDDEIVGRGYNQVISASDPTAHAEICALRDAARHLGNYRLPNTRLYVTVEPCTMCAGAMIHARVASLIYGAEEPRAGAVTSAARVFETPGLNHRVAVTAGVLADECAELMTSFFKERR